jgi:hypothetical protein
MAKELDSRSPAFAEDKLRGNDATLHEAKNPGSSWSAPAKLPPRNLNKKAVADATALQGTFGTSILKPVKQVARTARRLTGLRCGWCAVPFA